MSTAMRTVETGTTRFRLGHGAGFWVIAATFLIVMAFSTIPTPLYALYQARDGFSTVLITVIFAAYAVGVVASLYLAGHVSDWMGRRRIILAALLAEFIAGLVFLFWPEAVGLIVARFICGVGIGALTATATAHLSELRSVARPDEKNGRAGTLSSFVNLGGLALGPLVGGIFATWVSAPLVTPYIVFLALMVVAAVAVAFVPETVQKPTEARRYRPQRITIPAASRPLFFAAAAAAFAAFAIFGLFTSLAPSFLAGTLHETSRLLAGVVTFVVFAVAAVSQIVFSRLAARVQLRLALILMVVGVAGLAVGVLVVSLAVFVAAGVVAGAGVGVLFRSSIGVAASLARPGAAGEVLAALFLGAYAGLAVPVLLIGLALVWLPSTSVLVGFAAVVIVLVLISGARMLRAQA